MWDSIANARFVNPGWDRFTLWPSVGNIFGVRLRKIRRCGSYRWTKNEDPFLMVPY
jgi:hypothetical protein